MRSIGVLDPTRLETLLDIVTRLIESQVSEVDDVLASKLDEVTDEEVLRARRVAGRSNPSAPLDLVSATDQASVGQFIRAAIGPSADVEILETLAAYCQRINDAGH